MRILLVAPEISTPYTEGRKRFVLDLIETFSKDKEDVFLLTTTKQGQKTEANCRCRTAALGHGIFHLYYLIRQLPRVIQRFQPTIVCVFPYGTFRHIYGLASTWFMRRLDRTCHRHQVPCLTIMYSIDRHASTAYLRKQVSQLALSRHPDWDGAVVNVGINCRKGRIRPLRKKTDRPTLLFMAGMWYQTKKRVDYIIHTRGLGLLLFCGNKLSRRDVHLIIAAPLFESELCRNYLSRHPLNHWPETHVEFRGTVDIPGIFGEADLFVFPYRQNETQFIPTSVLEAMISGRAVALSDLPFLSPLAQGGKTAYSFPPDNPEKMSEILIHALEDDGGRSEKEEKALEYVIDNWCIDISARQIKELAAYKK